MAVISFMIHAPGQGPIVTTLFMAVNYGCKSFTALVPGWSCSQIGLSCGKSRGFVQMDLHKQNVFKVNLS